MKLRGMIAELSESYPEVGKMINNLMKNKIEVEAQIGSLSLTADLFLKGLDKLMTEDSPIMEGY